MDKIKAPLCKGSCRAAGFPNANGVSVWGSRVCETEGLFYCNSNFFYNPSVIFLRKCHLPLHKGGFR